MIRVALLVAAVAACGGDGAAVDAATGDLAALLDGATPIDAAVPVDAAAPLDGAPVADAAGTCAPAFAACSQFQDATDAGATVVVHFMPYEYTPKCLQVRVGQTVSLQGTFSDHPLRQACGVAPVLQNDVGDERSFTMSQPGMHGYYCLDHGNTDGQAMSGAIRVVP